MSTLIVSLFGKFYAHLDGKIMIGLEAFKVQELFCYLLLHRDRFHHRETLANLLWEEAPTNQSKRYLSKSLWQLQNALGVRGAGVNGRLLSIEPDWIQLHSDHSLRLDVAAFEAAASSARDVPGCQLGEIQIASLMSAVELFQGDLLEGWDQPWCLYERERLQQLYVVMLDKLMDNFESRDKFEAGLIYGLRSLQHNPMRENTHRRMMRLYYFAGDRTASLEQYQQCEVILARELSVLPASETVELYQRIRDDKLNLSSLLESAHHSAFCPQLAELEAVHSHLQYIQTLLTQTQRQVDQELAVLQGLIER